MYINTDRSSAPNRSSLPTPTSAKSKSKSSRFHPPQLKTQQSSHHQPKRVLQSKTMAPNKESGESSTFQTAANVETEVATPCAVRDLQDKRNSGNSLESPKSWHSSQRDVFNADVNQGLDSFMWKHQMDSQHTSQEQLSPLKSGVIRRHSISSSCLNISRLQVNNQQSEEGNNSPGLKPKTQQTSLGKSPSLTPKKQSLMLNKSQSKINRAPLLNSSVDQALIDSISQILYPQLQEQLETRFITKPEFQFEHQRRESAETLLNEKIQQESASFNQKLMRTIAECIAEQDKMNKKLTIFNAQLKPFTDLKRTFGKLNREQQDTKHKVEEIESAFETQLGEIKEEIRTLEPILFEKLMDKLENVRREAEQSSEKRTEQDKRAQDQNKQFKVQLYRQLDEMSLKNVKVAGEMSKRIQQCELLDTKFIEDKSRVEHHFQKINESLISHQTQIRNRIVLKDIVQFDQKISLLPTLHQFQQQNCETTFHIDTFKQKLSEQRIELNGALKVISRYDEVICDKAQKHSVVELRHDMQQSQKDLSAKLQTQIDHQKSLYSRHNLMETTQENFTATLQQLLYQKDTIQVLQRDTQEALKTMSKLQYQIDTKLNTTFLQNTLSRVEESHETLLKHFQNAIVVLNESLGLHHLRADETAQTKQNRLTHLRTQMKSLVNSCGVKEQQFVVTGKQHSASSTSLLHQQIPESVFALLSQSNAVGVNAGGTPRNLANVNLPLQQDKPLPVEFHNALPENSTQARVQKRLHSAYKGGARSRNCRKLGSTSSQLEEKSVESKKATEKQQEIKPPSLFQRLPSAESRQRVNMNIPARTFDNGIISLFASPLYDANQTMTHYQVSHQKTADAETKSQ